MSETIYRHRKRGTTYMIVGEAELQTSEALPEGSMLVVYRCQKTGNLWAQPHSEFTDGRFEKIRDEGGYLTAAPPSPEATNE